MAPRVLWYVQQHHLSSVREGGKEGGREGEVPAILQLLKVDLAKAEASNPYPDYRATSSSLPSSSSFSSSSMTMGGRDGGEDDEALTAQRDTKEEEEREKQEEKEGEEEMILRRAEATRKKTDDYWMNGELRLGFVLLPHLVIFCFFIFCVQYCIGRWRA